MDAELALLAANQAHVRLLVALCCNYALRSFVSSNHSVLVLFMDAVCSNDALFWFSIVNRRVRQLLLLIRLWGQVCSCFVFSCNL